MIRYDDRTLIADENKVRIDLWLAKTIPELTRSRIQTLIREGKIRLNKTITKSSVMLHIGDKITVDLPSSHSLTLEAQAIPLSILFEDAQLIILNKPPGMVVHPSPGHSQNTLVNALLHHCRDSLSGIGGVERPGIVHRLDKDTSGVLIIAKTDLAHQALSKQFKDRTIQKFYQVLVQSYPKKSEGEIIASIGRHPIHRKKMAISQKGRSAITRYRLTEKFENSSLLECQILTGRTHQIRVHLASIGCPVLGDKLYGRVATQAPRQMLHAWKLVFRHPTTKKEMEIKANLPEDFMNLLNNLRHGTTQND